MASQSLQPTRPDPPNRCIMTRMGCHRWANVDRLPVVSGGEEIAHKCPVVSKLFSSHFYHFAEPATKNLVWFRRTTRQLWPMWKAWEGKNLRSWFYHQETMGLLLKKSAVTKRGLHSRDREPLSRLGAPSLPRLEQLEAHSRLVHLVQDDLGPILDGD